LAYELARRANDVIEGKGDKNIRWAFRQFDSIPGELGYYSPKNLRDLNDKLREVSAKPNNALRADHLDTLAGSWTKEQADEFDKHLAEQRRI